MRNVTEIATPLNTIELQLQQHQYNLMELLGIREPTFFENETKKQQQQQDLEQQQQQQELEP